jgi:glycosyltransferase involved in cell wall biosynthesis
MKARAVDGKRYEYILTIGLIVKNEERNLEECLTALTYIMERVKSELIIVDTGSTDRTVEIAKLFTDKVYHFTWINDFAAARNEGYRRAKGEWFMYVDADEFFETDTLKNMIDFLNNPKLKSKYNSFSFYVNNVLSVFVEETSKFECNRGTRVSECPGFINPVHELLNAKGPTFSTGAVARHVGYVNDNVEESGKCTHYRKKKRNYELIKAEFDRDPDDLRTIVHFIDTYDPNFWSEEDFLKFLAESLEKAEKHPEKSDAAITFIKVCVFYSHKNSYIDVVATVERYFQLGKFPENNLCEMEMHLIKSESLFSLFETEDAISEYFEYERLYNMYKRGKLPTSQLSMYPFQGVDEKTYFRSKHTVFDKLIDLERYGEAEKFLIDLASNKLATEEDFKRLAVSFRNLQLKHYNEELFLQFIDAIKGDITKTVLLNGILGAYNPNDGG